ncbi:uncharacterized protein [Littorina saxatilis]
MEKEEVAYTSEEQLSSDSETASSGMIETHTSGNIFTCNVQSPQDVGSPRQSIDLRTSGSTNAQRSTSAESFSPQLAESLIIDIVSKTSDSKTKRAKKKMRERSQQQTSGNRHGESCSGEYDIEFGSDISTSNLTDSIDGIDGLTKAQIEYCPKTSRDEAVENSSCPEPGRFENDSTESRKHAPKITGIRQFEDNMSEDDRYAQQAHDLVDNVVSNAKEMVDDVIASAFRRLETRMSEREKTCESLKTGMLSKESTCISRDENFEIQDIGWLSIQEFTVEKGEEKINEYIKTWEYENSWLYCVFFLGEETFPYDKRYRFRVRWSIPTRRKPVPRATASVYFTFVVSTIKPKNYPVDVFYVFETNRLVHKPGQSRFREKWLKDIIESKVSMMAAVSF